MMFQDSPYRNLKYFCKSYLQLYQSEFPSILCYEHFVALMPRVLGCGALLILMDEEENAYIISYKEW